MTRRLETARQKLNEAIDVLEQGDEPMGPAILDALRATDELRDLVIADLGTAVSEIRQIEQGVSSLGNYVNSQRQAINDLAATVAALADLLVVAKVINADELARRRAELLAPHSSEDDGSPVN